MAITREAAQQQFGDIYRNAGLPELRPEELNDFGGWFNNSTDSGAYQGEGYDQSWEDLIPEITQRAQSRFNDPGNTSPDSNVSGSGGADPATYGSPAQRQFGEVLQAGQEMAAGGNPVFQVPGADLSPLIDEALSSLMRGSDPMGLQGRITGFLDRSSQADPRNMLNRLEAARENLTRGTMGAMADMRGMLAERGLISLPGAPEGAELDSTMRYMEPLQRAYLGEVRSAYNDVQEDAEGDELDALALATGWSRDQAAQQLSAAGAGTGRQQMLAEIALKSLEQNAEWNRFLAEFGLKREEVANAIQMGRLEQIQPLLQMFALMAQTSAAGTI